ncbi:hypothetical protein [Aeromicrobium sp. UC242_57]
MITLVAAAPAIFDALDIVPGVRILLAPPAGRFCWERWSSRSACCSG